MRNREEYGKDRKYKKYRKDRRKPAVWHMAAAVLFAAALIFPAALAETARAAELERPGSAVQSDSAAPAGSVIQTGTAVPVTKNLSYGYSAAEAEIPISITNHTETVMEINNISCILTDENSCFSVLSGQTGKEGQTLTVAPGSQANLCLVSFLTGMPVRTEPYSAGLQITYTDGKNSSQTQSYTLSVTVGQKSIESCRIENIEKQYYTGEEIQPSVLISNNGQALTAGQDYTAEYVSNTDVGMGRMIITGKGNYRGKTEKSFEIVWYDKPVDVRFNGETPSEAWYEEDVRITAKGCTVSDSLAGAYEESYLITAEGEHSLSLYCKTQEGYLTDAQRFAVKIDKNAPAVTKMQISGITNQTASVSVTAEDTGSGVSWYYLYCSPEKLETVNADTIKNSSGTMKISASEAAAGTAVFSLQGLSEGTVYYLYAAAEDSSGKLSETETGSFTAKKTVPEEVLVLNASASADTITVKALADTEVYGSAAYCLLDASGRNVVRDWQESNEFTGLTEGTGYYVHAKYTGSDAYMESKAVSAQVTTKYWAFVKAPEGLSARYGQTLKEVKLPEGWSWADSSAPVTVANSGYEARFPADAAQYDYSRIEGYDADAGYVARLLPVKVEPAAPVLTWKAGNTQTVVYNGKAAAAAAPEVALINNEVFQGSVSWSWRKASDSSGNFAAGLPSEPGTYVVRASVEAAGNYSAASADMTLMIDWLQGAPDAVLSDQNGKKLSAGAWCGEAVLTAPEGYEISFSPSGQYSGSVRSTGETGKDGAAATYYLRQKAGGGIARKTVNVYIDRTAPGGSISVGGAAWSGMVPEDKSELRISEQKEVTISAEDGQSGVKTVEYTISDKKCKSRDEIQKLGGWLIYNPDAKPDIKQNGANYVYVRITDHAGNMTWLSAGKILYETSSKNTGSSAGTSSGSSGSGSSGTAGQSGQTTVSGTGSGGSKNSGTKGNTAVKTPEKGTPYIHGRESISGWDAIRKELEDAKPGDTVILTMNGTSTVPGNVLSVIKGRDIRLVLNMEEEIVWTIDGRSFTTGEIDDIDFAVDREAEAIPADLIQELAGERDTRQLSLAYDGEFGFTAVLTIHLDEKDAGRYANLFSFQEQSGELKYLDSAEIGESGETEFSFTHASDYAIVLDEEPFDGTAQETEEEEELILPEREEEKEKEKDVRTTVLTLVICVIALAAGIGICVWLVRKYKKEETE